MYVSETNANNPDLVAVYRKPSAFGGCPRISIDGKDVHKACCHAQKGVMFRCSVSSLPTIEFVVPAVKKKIAESAIGHTHKFDKIQTSYVK